MKTSKPLRLLFCAVDVGGRVELYTKFLNTHYKNLIVPDSFVKFKLPESHYKTRYKYHFQYRNYPAIVQWTISLFFFLYAIFKYDAFYIISGENILTRKLLSVELFLYKLLSKKVIMHFVGADIRNSEYLRWKNEQLLQRVNKTKGQKPPPPLQNNFQKKLCTLAEKYADVIILTSPDLVQFFSEKNKWHYVPVFIDVEKFETELSLASGARDKNVITILHAPSNAPLKGAEYISNILKEIKESNNQIRTIVTTSEDYKSMTVHPPYTITKYALLDLYKQSDIVIDQILIGWYGLQSIEALLAGNKVICLVSEGLRDYLYPDCPIHIITHPSELKNAVQAAIEELRQKKINPDYAKEWVIKYYTIENNSEIRKIFDSILTGN
jgi:hypothetical protein